jgi:hypothetical protein
MNVRKEKCIACIQDQCVGIELSECPPTIGGSRNQVGVVLWENFGGLKMGFPVKQLL